MYMKCSHPFLKPKPAIIYFHRIFWFFFWLLAIGYGCTLFFGTAYQDWINHPTVIEVHSADFKVKNNFFPTITICSNNKVVKRQVKSVLLTNPWKDLSENDEKFANNFETALTAVAFTDLRTLQNLNNGTITIINEYQSHFPKLLHKASG